MKSKFFKITIVLLIILNLSLTNFLFVGNSLISYAFDDVNTNNKNIEFSAYFKDDEGNNISSLEKGFSTVNDTKLYLLLSVKNEGYFNGTIQLENSNFKLKDFQNEYVNKVEENSVTLNQINAGSSVELEIPIEFKKDINFDLNLLNTESALKLTGIYKNSSEKDIQIEANKTVNLKLVATNQNSENIENSVELITNKVLNVSGEDKRVVQFSINTGLKDNSFPIKDIKINVDVPFINNQQPSVEKVINLNTMTSFDFNYDNENTENDNTESENQNNQIEITLKNEPNENNQISWKESGNENIILTYIYDKNIELDNVDIKINTNITLYNADNTSINAKDSQVTIKKDDEKESILTATFMNLENEIYKGKLQEGIDRNFTTKTTLNVNMSNVLEEMQIREIDVLTTQEQLEQEELTPMIGQTANIVYKKTALNKNDIISVLGEGGSLTISNENDEIIANINKDSQADDNGNIIIDYGEGQKEIFIKTTKAVNTGKIRIANSKTIMATDENIIKNAVSLKTGLFAKTNITNNEELKQISKTELKETQTDAKIEIDKKELSTVIANDVEIKATLKTNNEKYDLFENPNFVIQFPDDVENINIESINIINSDEFSIEKQSVNNNSIILNLKGKQSSYSVSSIEGIIIQINAQITINKKAASKDAQITMGYTNENVTTYVSTNSENNIGLTQADIKIVAPTDVTTVNSIAEFNVEEIEQNKTKKISIERNSAEKTIQPEISVINNKDTTIQDIKILGTYPTKITGNTENTIDIKVSSINLEDENAKIYYSENESASDDLENTENGWKEDITQTPNVKKYLITYNELAPAQSLSASYTAILPANLNYNETASESFQVSYIDSSTSAVKTLQSTKLVLSTGSGPIITAELTAKIGNDIITGNSENITVKAGEVIKYQIKVSNTGTESANNINVSALVPEYTTYVEPEPFYEYTGAGYYKEFADKKNYEDIIETLEAGQSVIKEYEIRVSNNISNGQEISNIATVNDINTNSLTLTAETGDIRVSLKRINSGSNSIYQYDPVEFYVIIENTSSNTLNNITLTENLPENTQLANISLYTGLLHPEIKEEDIDFSGDVPSVNIPTTDDNTILQELNTEDKVKIDELKPNETKVLYYYFYISAPNEFQFSVALNINDEKYRSNVWEESLGTYSFDFNIESSIENNTILKANDELIYTITIKNNINIETDELYLRDDIPNDLVITKITQNDTELEKPESNSLEIPLNISANSQTVIKIYTTIPYDLFRINAITITNDATLSKVHTEIAHSNTLTHIIEATDIPTDDDDEDNDNPNNNNPSDNPGDNENPDDNITNGDKIISGMAWLDENSNGKKDTNESSFSNITINLLNTNTNTLVKDTNGDILSVTPNNDGIYILNNIKDGKYIVIFNYDTKNYSITKFKASGISEDLNSNALNNNLLIDSISKKVTSSEILDIKNNNITNINIGLIYLQNFDLKLEKFVNKIIIQNNTGTTVKSYNNANIAKIELDAKQLNNSSLVIEYIIKVSNIGEVDGYVKEIVDYIPNDLSFSSELNKEWYQKNSNLYNSSLSNDVIAPGESKEISLTLTKIINENNTGLVNNIAEISKDYNELGLQDINSQPGNRAQGENDMGSADVIISIKTGELILYATIISTILILLIGVVIYFQVRKIKSKKSS